MYIYRQDYTRYALNLISGNPESIQLQVADRYRQVCQSIPAYKSNAFIFNGSSHPFSSSNVTSSTGELIKYTWTCICQPVNDNH